MAVLSCRWYVLNCRGEAGCHFYEISNLVEPAERPDMEVRAEEPHNQLPRHQRSTRFGGGVASCELHQRSLGPFGIDWLIWPR
jgi:hypothetical protein